MVFAQCEKTKIYYHTKIFREIDALTPYAWFNPYHQWKCWFQGICSRKNKKLSFVKNTSWRQLFIKNRCFHEIFVKKVWYTVACTKKLDSKFFSALILLYIYQYLCSHLTLVEMNWYRVYTNVDKTSYDCKYTTINLCLMQFPYIFVSAKKIVDLGCNQLLNTHK